MKKCPRCGWDECAMYPEPINAQSHQTPDVKQARALLEDWKQEALDVWKKELRKAVEDRDRWAARVKELERRLAVITQVATGSA